MFLRLLGILGALVLATTAVAAVSPKLIGNPKAGKATFVTTCGTCHRLKAAASSGEIGPDLNHVKLTEPTIVKAITNGGGTVMTPAQLQKYATQMVAYKGALTAKEIQDVAAFVYVSTHPA